MTGSLSQLYESGMQLLSSRDALQLLRKPKEQIVQLLLATKQQWIESMELAVRWKNQHEYGQYLSTQRYIAQWVIH